MDPRPVALVWLEARSAMNVNVVMTEGAKLKEAGQVSGESVETGAEAWVQWLKHVQIPVWPEGQQQLPQLKPAPKVEP